MAVRVLFGPVKETRTETDNHSNFSYHPHRHRSLPGKNCISRYSEYEVYITHADQCFAFYGFFFFGLFFFPPRRLCLCCFDKSSMQGLPIVCTQFVCACVCVGGGACVCVCMCLRVCQCVCPLKKSSFCTSYVF